MVLRVCLRISEPANHELDHGKMDHRLARQGPRLVVLAEPAILPQPSEGTLDHPAARENLEPLVCAEDDGEEPVAKLRRPPDQLAGVAAVCPDDLQPREKAPQLRQHQPGADPVLDRGAVHHHGEQKARGIDYDVPLAALDFLARVVPTEPPFSVVFTDWLSTMAALGVGARPSRTRVCSRIVS